MRVEVFLRKSCLYGSQITPEASFQRMGGGATRRMGLAATPKCKENAYWKNKEREEFVMNSFITTPFSLTIM